LLEGGLQIGKIGNQPMVLDAAPHSDEMHARTFRRLAIHLLSVSV